MFRKFYDVLSRWEENNVQEPMLVVGARQVGKTWIIRKFCSERYERYVYFNFEANPELESIFEGSLEPKAIIEGLEILFGCRIDVNTAICFDEIQRCERAITSLKYFCEAEENYRVIGAGSLLGVKLNRFENSFPVGKIRIEKMYPMDFEEFLIAAGEERLCDKIRSCYEKLEALPEAFHNKALELYQKYIYVGGMPQCVLNLIAKDMNIIEFDRALQENILLAYSADMNKYTISAAEGVKIGEVYESIPRQLARENPKFKYKDVRTHANKRDFYQPLDWLVASMLIYKVTKVEVPQPPLKAYMEEGNFKIYMSDVGLLSFASGVQYKDILPASDNIFKGALTENYVIQSMVSKGIHAYYYKPDASMEIDLLLDRQGDIIPVEIKAGRHVRSTSLKNYAEKYHPNEMLRISYKNFGEMNGVRSIPLYAVYCI